MSTDNGPSTTPSVLAAREAYWGISNLTDAEMNELHRAGVGQRELELASFTRAALDDYRRGSADNEEALYRRYKVMQHAELVARRHFAEGVLGRLAGGRVASDDAKHLDAEGRKS